MPDDNQVDNSPLLTGDHAVRTAEPARRRRTLEQMQRAAEESMIRREKEEEEEGRLAAMEPHERRKVELAAVHERRVAEEVQRQQIRADATAVRAASGLTLPTDEGTWAEQLLLEDDEVEWHIDGLMFVGSNVLLNASAKSGKTTLALNVVRCLLSGDSLFGRFPVKPLADGRRVAWWNAELAGKQARAWLRDMDMPQPESLVPLHLRGQHVPFEVQEGEDWAVKWLRKYDVSVWVLDPKSALFRGEENSATETGAWLSAIDRIKQRAGVDTVFLVHHTSESGGLDTQDDNASRFLKGRGSSRTEGWADVVWSWTGRFEEPRYLGAMGRDVNQPLVGGMIMNPQTHLLTWDGGTTSPNEDRRHRLMLTAHAALVQADGPLQMGVLVGLMPGVKKEPKRDAINYGVTRGYIEQFAGPGVTKLHVPGPVDPHADSAASATVTWHRAPGTA